MTKLSSFILLIALLLAACAAPAPEPTPTSTQTAVPTVTNTPTATTPPTPVPLVEPFMIVEGMVIHQICEAIQAEHPQAGCPIVAREDVPLSHKFMAFMDEAGELTGYGLDFGEEPWTRIYTTESNLGYRLDNTDEARWCGGETGAVCDSWLWWETVPLNPGSVYLSIRWLEVGNDFKLWHIDDSSVDVMYHTPLSDDDWGVLTFKWALFPISLQYQDILEELGMPLDIVVRGN